MADTATAKMGRPTAYTDELAEELAQRVASGETLQGICEVEGMPARRTVADWYERYPHFRSRMSRARLVQAHMLSHEVLDRARAAHDVGTASAASAFTKAAQLLLPAFDRATFGQQVQHEHNIVRTLSDDELRLRTLEAIARAPTDQRAGLVLRALATWPGCDGQLRERGLLESAPPVTPKGDAP